MSRHELYPLPGAVVVTRGVVGWDRPLQTFFAQLFSINEQDKEEAHLWVGTFPRELDTAAAAIAVVSGDCAVPDDLGAKLEPNGSPLLGLLTAANRPTSKRGSFGARRLLATSSSARARDPAKGRGERVGEGLTSWTRGSGK